MSFILLFLMILSISVFISIIFEKHIAITIATSVLLIIILLYIFSLLNILLVGFYFVILIAVLALIYDIYYFIRKDRSKLKCLYSPAVVIYFIFFLISFIGSKGLVLTQWDEFSHWGLIVKNMYFFDTIGNHEFSTVQFVAYPPAVALFEYFYLKLSPILIEGKIFLSKNILYFSLLIILFKDIKWKQVVQILIRFIVIISLPLMFYSDFYHSLLIDGLLGAVFAYIIVYYYTNKLDTYKLVNISLGVFVLTIMKDSGFGLSIIALIIIMIDLLFVGRDKTNLYIKSENNLKKKFNKIALLVTPFLCMLLGRISWKIFSNINVASDAINKHTSIREIIDTFTGNHSEYQVRVVNNFFKFITNETFISHSVRLTYVGIFIVLCILGIFLITNSKSKAKKRTTIAVILVITGLIVYTGYLLLLYLFVFSSQEAVVLAACQRYLSTYLLAAILILISLIVINTKKKIAALLVLSLILLIDLSPITDLTLLSRIKTGQSVDAVAKYNTLEEIDKNIDYKKDKIYFLDINASHIGYEYWLARYKLTPTKINPKYTWRIGQDYYDNDQYTLNINVDEWEKTLIDEKYTYVYLLYTSERFKVNFGKAFENGSDDVKNDSFYEVNVIDQKIVLKRIELS